MLSLRPRRFGKLIDTVGGVSTEPAEIACRAGERARELQALGLRERSIVALRNNNTPAFFIDFFALQAIGAVPFPVGERMSDLEFAAITSTISIAAAIYSSGEIVKYAEFNDARVPAGTALILLSSGTSGVPKLIFFSDRLLERQLSALAGVFSTETWNVLCFLPTSFGHGLIANALAPLLSGRNLYIAPKFSLNSAIELPGLLETHAIDTFSSTPAQWKVLTANAAFWPIASRCLKEVHVASAPMDTELRKLIQSRMPSTELKIHYGLTECASWVTVGVDSGQTSSTPGWVGYPISKNIGIEVVSGEIFVSHRYEGIHTLCLGDERLNELPPGRGLATGDLGELTEWGLCIRGRKSDFINKGGEKISPFEVETQIRRHERVKEAVVFSCADGIYGEKVAAVVVTTDGKKLNRRELAEFLRDLLSANKIPEKVFTEAEIPCNDNGKISRRDLQIRYSGEGKKQ